jgi:hypothetical protein
MGNAVRPLTAVEIDEWHAQLSSHLERRRLQALQAASVWAQHFNRKVKLLQEAAPKRARVPQEACHE